MKDDIQILIVEDNRLVAMELKKRVENLGYTVFAIVDSGKAALEVLNDKQLDLVLMDIIIKNRMSGINTTQKINARFNIPVIYVSACGDAKTLARARKFEPCAYISKPFKDIDLYASIEMALLNHAMKKRLRDSEIKYRLIFETAADMIVSIDDQNRITDCNNRVKKILGYTPRELIGQSFVHFVFADDVHKVGDALDEIRSGEIIKTNNYRMVQKDGSCIHVKMNTSMNDEIEDMCSQIICFIENVTENKQMEVEITQYREHLEDLVKERTEELERSNEELQHFAYTISHDLQEPLRMVSVYTQLLGHRYKGKLDSDADAFIENASGGAIRMYRLIQDVLTYSRIDRWGKAFQNTDCSEVVQEVFKNLKIQIDKSGGVIQCDSLPTVSGDKTQLVQLFQNLISNALKYCNKKKPKVRIGAKKDNLAWLFYIKDNGIGIDSRYAKKIFMIFQRLHNRDTYSGTGVGLAICKKIVERHHGKIWVESQEGKGATFYFTLPRTVNKKVNSPKRISDKKIMSLKESDIKKSDK